MTTKHSPTPTAFWVWDDNGFYDANRQMLLHYTTRDDGIHVENEADARLIAAAPELLAALERARGSVKCAISHQDVGTMGRRTDESVLAQIDAAIAKAIGVKKP